MIGNVQEQTLTDDLGVEYIDCITLKKNKNSPKRFMTINCKTKGKAQISQK